MGVGAGLYMCDVVVKSSRSLSHLLMSSCILWSSGWMHHNATWYGGRPRPRRLCVKWGPSPSLKRVRSPQFSARVYCGQTAGRIKMPLGTEIGLGPGDIVSDGDQTPPKKAQPPPNFSPMFIVAKRLYVSGYHMVLR